MKLLRVRLIQLLLLLIAIGPVKVFSEENSNSKNPHHKGLLSSLNLGFRYSSILQNRGVILYRDFQIDPIIAVFLFDDRFEFLGDSIGYRDFVLSDRLRLRSRLVSITDKPLFPNYDAIRFGRPNRSDTFEWSNRAELFLPGYNDNYRAEIDLGFAKDLSGHHGSYFDLQAKFKMFDFRLPKLETKIEPNLFSSIGWGDSAHNQYFYGPSADISGLNNISYGLWFAFPEEADRFYPIVQLARFEVIGKNRNAEFAKDNNEGWLLSFIATYGVLE